MTDTTAAKPNQAPQTDASYYYREVTTYKQKRVVLPMLAGFCVLFLTAHPFIAFISYIIFGLFYDWIAFRVDGLRDSQVIPSHQLYKEQMTSEQYDKMNNYLVILRQSAFALSVSAASICLLFFEDADYQFVFAATYIAITVVAIFWGIETNDITYPRLQTTDGENGNLCDENSIEFNNDSLDRLDRLDIASSAAYWPGGILDPNRHN